jgi:hypothetical protein
MDETDEEKTIFLSPRDHVSIIQDDKICTSGSNETFFAYDAQKPQNMLLKTS